MRIKDISVSVNRFLTISLKLHILNEHEAASSKKTPQFTVFP